jgi:hypothetical protein
MAGQPRLDTGNLRVARPESHAGLIGRHRGIRMANNGAVYREATCAVFVPVHPSTAEIKKPPVAAASNNQWTIQLTSQQPAPARR